MKTYTIGCDIQKEIQAQDEDEVMEMFYDELAEENDCLENHTTIEELKGGRK